MLVKRNKFNVKMLYAFNEGGGDGSGGAGAAGDPAAAAASAAAATGAAATGAANLDITSNFTGIPEAFSKDPDFQGFNKLDDVLGEFKTLKGIQKNREANGLVDMIGPNSTPEQVQAFYEKIGKPKSAAEYELARPEDLPQGVDYSDELAAKFAQFAHENHMTKAQAQAAHAFYHGLVKDSFAGHEAAGIQAIEANFTELETKWGKQDSPEFAANHKNALKAFNFVADADLAGKFKGDPQLASNPLVLDLLSRLGSKMSNDSVPTVHGVEPAGRFTESVPAVEKAIKEFHNAGKFKEMMTSDNPKAQKDLRNEWNALWAKKNELSAQG